MKPRILTLSSLVLLLDSPLLFAQGGPVPAVSNKVVVVPSSQIDSSKIPGKSIRIVCASSVKSGLGPLYIIDGRPFAEDIVKSLNPADIDQINILKGTRATALYGMRAAEGAILITTKKK